MVEVNIIVEVLGNRLILNTVDLPFKIINPAFWLEVWAFLAHGINYKVFGFIMSDMLLCFGLLIILFVSSVANKNIKGWTLGLSVLYSFSKWAGIIYWVFFTDFSGTLLLMNSVYVLNFQTEIFKLVIAVIGLACLQLMSFSRAVYYILSYFIIAFGIIAVSSNNLLLLFLCIEGVSLSAYLLALSSQTFGGVSAAAKYFVFGSIGSIFLLGGIVNIYPIGPSLKVGTLYSSVSSITSLEWPLSLILLGLLIKLGSAPFHIWLPDVYGAVSMFTIIIYSLLSKAIILFSFLNVVYATGFNCSHFLSIEIIAILSLIVGCFGAIRQFEIKKFIAYSSIVQLGFILSSSADIAFFYIITYLVSLYVLLFSISGVLINGKEIVYLSDLRFMKVLKLEVVLLVSSLFSLAGIPPFVGFYGKFLVWLSLVEDIYLFSDFISLVLLIINMLVSVIIIFYYMRLIISIFTVSLNDIEKSYFVVGRVFSVPYTIVAFSFIFLLIGGFIFNWVLMFIW